MDSSTPTSKGALVVACTVAVTLAAGWARAQPTAGDRETARALMQEGRELRGQGDESKALRCFQAADDIMHVPTTGLEVARTQVSLGLLVEARDMIASIRKTLPKPGDPEPFNEARRRADELDGALEGRVPTLTAVVISASGLGPVVSIDGVVVPAATLGIERSIDPGHHVIVARVAQVQARQEFDLVEGERKQLRMFLADADPGAVTRATVSAPPEAVGVAQAPGKRSHSPSSLTYAGLGAATAGLLVGIVSGAISWSDKSSLRAECPNLSCPPGRPSQDLDSANRLAIVSNAFFGFAGVGAAIAIASVAVGTAKASSPGAPTAGLTVRPYAGAGFAGVHGSF
jgi:hypothetical protein